MAAVRASVVNPNSLARDAVKQGAAGSESS